MCHGGLMQISIRMQSGGMCRLTSFLTVLDVRPFNRILVTEFKTLWPFEKLSELNEEVFSAEDLLQAQEHLSNVLRRNCYWQWRKDRAVLLRDLPDHKESIHVISKRGSDVEKPFNLLQRILVFFRSQSKGSVFVTVTPMFGLVKVLFGPSVVFVLGGPGAGKGTQCTKIAVREPRLRCYQWVRVMPA